MAISKNPALKGFSGTIGNVVVRQFPGDMTVLSIFPDMSKVVPSENQKRQRSKFARAQNYAKKLLENPEIKAFYKEQCSDKQRPHNVLISDLLKGKTPFPDDYTEGK
jgi:hypothetical protein